jgi:4-diphosphocytidyl-2-C-methyl-D-erythritol kinase
MDSEKSYLVKSYAKINITIDILNKRTDGYHSLATIMQTVDLSDTICLEAIPEDEIQLVCSIADLETPDNLVFRAAKAVRQHLSLKRGVKIELQKRIPISAGLGGGSSNAAAVIIALQKWWKLPLSHNDMLGIAASLGSDVSFFLTGGLAICEGRGELVTPMRASWPAAMRWLLLVKPSIGVSAGVVYGALPSSDYTTDEHTRAVRKALENQEQVDIKDIYNGLERVVIENYPEVKRARDATLRAGASIVRLSGSGPTLFAPFSDLKEATMVQQALAGEGYEVYVTFATGAGHEEIRFY